MLKFEFYIDIEMPAFAYVERDDVISPRYHIRNRQRPPDFNNENIFNNTGKLKNKI